MTPTPGPWHVVLKPDGRPRPCICTASGGTIATLADGRPQSIANAYLFAAALETAAERDRLKAINAEPITSLKMKDAVVEAARRVLAAQDRILDDPPPIKYRAAWRELADLRQTLVDHDNSEAGGD